MVLPCGLICLVALLQCAAWPAKAERVAPSDAAEAASGWVSILTQIKGSWGGSPSARVADVRELKQASRVLGYYCPVRPSGYVVVSLYTDLAPIKAYSTSASLDSNTEGGIISIIKDGLGRVLNHVERRAGSLDQLRPETVHRILGSDYRANWHMLRGHTGRAPADLAGPVPYQGGRVLLSTAWSQEYPYNALCPQLGCSNTSLSGRAYVGCTPLAGVQIMKHWCWPPFKTGSDEAHGYLWADMPDQLFTKSTTLEIEAVARLCSDAGAMMDVDYDCEGTSGPLRCESGEVGCTSLEDAYTDNFKYVSSDCEDRDDYTAEEWFAGIKAELTFHRPMPYHIPAHNVVVDGWQEVGSPPLRQYHINYGWGPAPDNRLAWYTVDEIPYPEGEGSFDEDEEYRMANLKPNCTIGSTMSGTYTAPVAYWYFDQDASGTSATFWAPYQALQFLPGVAITGTGSRTATEAVRILGVGRTYLFADGDPSVGIHAAAGGTMTLSNGGALSIVPLVAPRHFKSTGYDSESRSISLKWDWGYCDDDTVVIERKDGSVPTWSVIGTAAWPRDSFQDSNVEARKAYTYRARSSGHGRLSEFTPEVVVLWR